MGNVGPARRGSALPQRRLQRRHRAAGRSPGLRVAYAAFANSSLSYGFHGELQRRVLATILPAEPNASPAAPVATSAGAIDTRWFLGAFRRKTQITRIREAGDRLMVDIDMFPRSLSGARPI